MQLHAIAIASVRIVHVRAYVRVRLKMFVCVRVAIGMYICMHIYTCVCSVYFTYDHDHDWCMLPWHAAGDYGSAQAFNKY